MTVLVVAAHPDDEVLGCGGTMAKLAAAGHDVHVAILGEGITSRYERREEAPAAEIAALHAVARSANAVLGVRDVHLFGLPDNRFDTVPMLDVVKIVERLIDGLRPERVYTQHGGDLNVDHGVVFRAVLTATRPMAGHPVKEVLAYEVASSSEWAFGRFAPEFRATVFEDVSATIERKVAAMQAYESEARRFPHPRAPESLRAIAARWGSVSGFGAAEAFDLVRRVG